MNLDDWQAKFAGDPGVTVQMHPTALNNGSVMQKAVLITMPDGTRVAGCTWDGCVEVAAHPTSIAIGHWRTHTGEPAPKRQYIRKVDSYGHLSFKELADALQVADTKVKRAEAARDKALDQVANMRAVHREVVENLREQLEEAYEELRQVRQAVKTLYPGALG